MALSPIEAERESAHRRPDSVCQTLRFVCEDVAEGSVALPPGLVFGPIFLAQVSTVIPLSLIGNGRSKLGDGSSEIASGRNVLSGIFQVQSLIRYLRSSSNIPVVL